MTGPTLFSLAAAVALGAAWLAIPPAFAQGAEEPAAETGDGGAQAAPDDAAPDDAAALDEAAADPAAIPEMALGDPDAPVTLIEYASFTCPHCANFAADQFPQLKADYIDTGRVRFVHREVFFDRFGLWAALIARCGDEALAPGRYFAIADMLYEDQREWVGEGDPAAIAERLRAIGRAAGLDDAQIEACLTNEAEAEALYAWFQANAEADGVNSTPTLIIDGEKYSNMAYEELAAILDERLAQ
jgi:protein-disulfide isomerase